jgi:flavin reductase (DIM6/NTAB) family NADH-FMN oxidoreductase RutF
MKIEIDDLLPAQQYKLLSATIVPRPIALVTTLSAAGRVNAAPFSFFNVMGEDPPVASWVCSSLPTKASRTRRSISRNAASSWCTWSTRTWPRP